MNTTAKSWRNVSDSFNQSQAKLEALRSQKNEILCISKSNKVKSKLNKVVVV